MHSMGIPWTSGSIDTDGKYVGTGHYARLISSRVVVIIIYLKKYLLPTSDVPYLLLITYIRATVSALVLVPYGAVYLSSPFCAHLTSSSPPRRRLVRLICIQSHPDCFLFVPGLLNSRPSLSAGCRCLRATGVNNAPCKPAPLGPAPIEPRLLCEFSASPSPSWNGKGCRAPAASVDSQ